MLYLHQIAHDDFILFNADQLASQALEAMRRLKPISVVVRRQQGCDVYYYLYTDQEFLNRLVHADGDWSLLDALNLYEWRATPGLAYDDAEAAPPRCVVNDDDRVVGVYDASLPADDYGRGIRRGEAQSELLESATVSRSLQADFPEKVALEQTASLLVSLVLQAGQKPAIPIAVQVGTQVDVVVQAQRGFALEGSGEGKLTITDEEETLPIQFKLRATELGPGRIRVLCFQGGQPLGAITLTPTIVADDQRGDERRRSGRQSLASLVVTQPDLTLLVLEHGYQGQPAITLRLTALDPALELNLKPFGPIRLRMDPLQYFQDFFEDIEGLPIRTAEEQAIAERKLALKGARLFQDMLPEDLRVLLWNLRQHIQSVQVLSDEPWIPWELLKLQGKENGRVVEGPFLSEVYAMTRWFPGVGRRPEVRLKNMAIVVPSDSGLVKAPEERAYLLSLADDQRQVTEIPATYLDVMEALSRGEHDGWHFTGHGRFEAPDPNRSPILLERSQRLCAAEICGRVSNCGLTRPLVFLNACQAGREALSLTGIGSWARSFIEAGAAGFVGPLWSVYDDAACLFAQAFYNRLLAGEPIGQAVKEARAAVRPLNNPTWLAYTVFADPLATVR